MARLRLLVECRGETFFYQGDDPAVRIGRSLKCEFNIPKDDLSREHCLFEPGEGEEEYFITDLGSKNGISINGNKLTPLIKTPVKENATIVLSNIYYLKINPLSVQTKADIVLKRINPEIDTRTFQLEIPDEKKATPPKVKKILKQKKQVQSEEPKKESAKMIIGFILILGFVIYQAFGA